MKIGDKVISKLYADKGIGTIVAFNELVGEKYVDILFSNGENISTKKEDVILCNTPFESFKNKNFEIPEVFIARNLLLKIKQNLSENKIITSTNFKIKPLPHQLLTVNFVIKRFKPRCLIADEVGLGKTIEAALVYEEFKLRGIVKKILIVVPSGLVLQWHEELYTKFNEQFIIYSKEYIKTLKKSYGEETNVWELHDKIIVSIDSVKYMKIDDTLDNKEAKRRQWHNKHIFEHLTEAGFDMVIIDEAHKLSKYQDGYETARFKLGKYISERVPILLLLTATPHQGKSELFLNLLKLIDPIIFTSKASLIPELVREITVRNKKRAVVDFNGQRIFKNRITSMIEIARNSENNKLEIELYNKITEYISKYYNLSANNNKIYVLLMMLYQRIASSSSFAILDAMRKRLEFLENHNEYAEIDDYNNLLRIKLFSEIENNIEKSFLKECIKLAKRITENFLDAKFNKLLEIIEETIKREEKPDLKFIVFTEFRATQNAIIEYLSKYGYQCSYIHGELSREEKVEQVDNFKNKTQIMVSTDAGGEGINLQFCYCMINFDLPWNPSKLEQRIGRIDRIGQTENVLIFNFHLKDTVEDRVRVILEEKLKIIKEEFGEDKYADVLNLLQDEFSFDKVYIDAVAKLKSQEKELNIIAENIYKRAKEILQQDELMLPFTNFEENPNELLNDKLNSIIKQFVFNILKSKNIEISEYSKLKNFYHFKNPYNDTPKIYKNITFDPIAAMDNPRADMINANHLLFKKMKKEIEDSNIGLSSAIKLKINKFEEITGMWFVYLLRITNSINKNAVRVISVFMEDEEFCNSRIGKYLDEKEIDNFELINNVKVSYDWDKLYSNAEKYAKEKAANMFESIKFDWIEEIRKYEEKLDEYFQFKKQGIINIKIDNIRESKLRALQQEKENEVQNLKKQKNIVPKLELCQVAYLEFV